MVKIIFGRSISLPDPSAEPQFSLEASQKAKEEWKLAEKLGTSSPS